MDCTNFRAGMPLSKCADCGRARREHVAREVSESSLVAALNPKHATDCGWPCAACSCEVGPRLHRLLAALNERPYFEVTP